MEQKCIYHPVETAHWQCDQCNRTFCPQCVETREMGGHRRSDKKHLCPRCHVFVQWLGVENIIKPFWNQLPQFFLYPFSKHPLLLLLGLSFVSVLLTRSDMFVFAGILAVWAIAFNYAYTILKTTAGGDLTAPRLNCHTLLDHMGPVVKQVGIYLALFFLTGMVIDNVGMVPGSIFLLSAMIYLPAMIILLVTTGSLLQAINPIFFITLANRIGRGYWLLLLFYLILGGAPAILGQQVIQHLPPAPQIFFSTLVRLYYAFVSYHLMGYVILQYHRDIGFDVFFEDFKDYGKTGLPAEMSAEVRLLKRIDQLVKEGEHHAAVDEIEKEMGAKAFTDLLLSQRYLALLTLLAAKEKIGKHAIIHLSLLVRQEEKEAAVAHYLHYRIHEAASFPDGIVLFKVGVWLNETGHSNESLRVFNRLTKAFPADPLVPKSYFRVAQILNEHLLHPQKAKEILKGLLTNYPDNDIIPYVKRYLKQLG